MQITRLHIENFKCFGSFELEFSEGTNILVGNNEAGKSTVLEATYLALTGVVGGRHLRQELSQHLFNNHAVQAYLASLRKPPVLTPPSILIEIYLADGECPRFEGNANTRHSKATGFSLRIEFDEDFRGEYQALIAASPLDSLPLEYYKVTWLTFARDAVSPRSLPLKSALIDSSSSRYQNGSDIYISRIIRDYLDTKDVVGISQAYRKMTAAFRTDPSVEAINKKIQSAAKISAKEIALSTELPGRSDWEDSLVTYVQDVPFRHIGKGEQCLIKTRLALSKAKEASVVLLEEPENHLSHASLSTLMHHIKTDNPDKQIILSTHSSFVANKLGLDNIILLNDRAAVRFEALSSDTRRFFEKVAGYDTLRLVLAQKAILVEGDSDELVVQKAYMLEHDGRLPIEDGIDVISVGTSFLRFLEVARQIKKQVVVVTDNDGDIAAINKKYSDYIGPNAKPYVKICFDGVVDQGPAVAGRPFNYNTLEPKMVKANSLALMNKVFGTHFSKEEDLHAYMHRNKTECALKVFETQEPMCFPDYIQDAVR